MKHYKIIIFILAIFFTANAWCQCGNIYESGVDNMKMGKYKEAISLFKAAMECDPSLKKQCTTNINLCNRRLAKKQTPAVVKEEVAEMPKLSVTADAIYFEAQDKKTEIVKITSIPKSWDVKISAHWVRPYLKITVGELHIKCDENNFVGERETDIIVHNGKKEHTIHIIQKGVREIFDVNPKSVEFSTKTGGEQEIKIESNGGWEIESMPDWIMKQGNLSDALVIKVAPTKLKRRGYIQIKSKEGKGNWALEVIQENKRVGKIKFL